jgi:hypothetical protein
MTRMIYGIQGMVVERFRSSLAHIKQKVEIKSPKNTEIFSPNWGTINTGVPLELLLWP